MSYEEAKQMVLARAKAAEAKRRAERAVEKGAPTPTTTPSALGGASLGAVLGAREALRQPSGVSSGGSPVRHAMPTPLPPAPLLQTNPLERQLPTRPASFTAPSAFTAPGAAPDAGSMADKVRQIRAELLIDPSLSMAATIAEANEQMGLVAQGPLLSQVEQLLAVMGLNR